MCEVLSFDVWLRDVSQCDVTCLDELAISGYGWKEVSFVCLVMLEPDKFERRIVVI